MYYEREIYKLEQKIEELKAKQELRPVWRPEIEESYYVADVGAVSEYRWGDDEVDQHYLDTGTLFKTEQEAEDYARALILIETIRRERFKAQGHWCPSGSETIFSICWDRLENDLGVITTSWLLPSSVFGLWQDLGAIRGVIKKYDSELGWYFVDYLPSVN